MTPYIDRFKVWLEELPTGELLCGIDSAKQVLRGIPEVPHAQVDSTRHAGSDAAAASGEIDNGEHAYADDKGDEVYSVLEFIVHWHRSMHYSKSETITRNHLYDNLYCSRGMIDSILSDPRYVAYLRDHGVPIEEG